VSQLVDTAVDFALRHLGSLVILLLILCAYVVVILNDN